MTENRLLRHQLQGRIRLREGERQALAVIGQQLGKQALKAVAQIVTPETILGWHRPLVAQQCDGSQQRQSPGRPTIDPELEALIVRIAREHRSWGYDRIVGALANLGLIVSAQTVGNVRKHPKRGRKRLFNAALHALRLRVERTFAWEDKFKRLLLRIEQCHRHNCPFMTSYAKFATQPLQ